MFVEIDPPNHFWLLANTANFKSCCKFLFAGMSNLLQVTKIYQTVTKYHTNFALLHCTSAYPTPLEDVNLRVINLYKTTFSDIVIGYSGHELGEQASLGAVALGAKV